MLNYSLKGTSQQVTEPKRQHDKKHNTINKFD